MLVYQLANEAVLIVTRHIIPSVVLATHKMQARLVIAEVVRLCWHPVCVRQRIELFRFGFPDESGTGVWVNALSTQPDIQSAMTIPGA